MITFSAKPYKGPEKANFEQAWFRQPSTARMTRNGTRLDCSDTVDATGHYIWRKDGYVNGSCCGIDFQQAAEKRRTGTCGDEGICSSAAATQYETFAYDAAMVMAHGLDRLVRRGLDPYSAGANELATAMRQSSLYGASGNLSFEENGDRRVDELENTVYNYNTDDNDLRVVGLMAGDGSFTPSAPIIFSDGTERVPNVQRGVRDK